MTGIMADLLLLILFIAILLLLCTGFDRIFALPFWNPSRHEARDLLVALEDLLLPMGSFPISLLHPWASTPEARLKSPTALLHSLQPKIADSKLKPNVTFSSIKLSSDNNNSMSKPTAAATSTERMPIESGPNSISKPHPTDISPIDTGLNTTKIPPPAKPIPDDSQSISSEDHNNQPFFDSLEYQQSLDDDAQLAELGNSSPHPEQQAALTGPLSGATTVLSEEEDQQHQQREGEQTTESTTVLAKLLSETQAFEKAIRELVDPDGIYGLDLQKMIDLVASIVQRQKAAEEGLSSEKVRSRRAEEDLRHGWEDLREVFERVINGQNASMNWTQQKYDEILEENETLQKENETLQKYGRMKERYINNLKTLKNAKEWAEQEATTLKAEVESRIHDVEEKHRQEGLAAQESNTRDRNTLLCQMRMVQDSLNSARHHERKRRVELRESHQFIQKQQTEVKSLRSKLAVSNEVSAAAEQRLREQLEAKLQQRKGQITALELQLQEAKRITETLQVAKATAEAEQRRAERSSSRAEQLSEHWKEETTRLREDKEHVVSGLHFEEKVLKKTIDELVNTIVGLESGGEVQGLEAQVEKSQKQLRKQKRQMKNLEAIIKALDQKAKDDSESVSKENAKLKKELEQALRVTDSGLEEQARKLKEQEEENSRKLEENKREVVESANRKAEEDAEKMREEHQRDLEKAAKTESDLRIEIEALKSQVKQVADSKKGGPASAQPGGDAEELIVQTREADEANNLLLEIGTNGVVRGTLEHAVLQELSNAKLALYDTKDELRRRGVNADREVLLSMISSGKMDEQYIQQLDTTTWMQLAKQAKSTQAKLPKVESMLGTSGDLQKDAILEVINAPHREIKKARGLKRHTQRPPGIIPPISSTGVQPASPTSHSNMMGDMPGKSVPGPADEGTSSLTSQRQGNKPTSVLGFNWDDLDKKHPVWAGVNFDMHKEGSGEATMPQGSANAEPPSAKFTPFSGFHSGGHPPFQPLTAADNLPSAPSKAANNVQNSKPIDEPTQVKRDHRTSFADLMASVPGPPVSSERPTTAVVPEPVPHTASKNIISNAQPADIATKSPQKPVGWTDSMTKRVKDMLQEGDEVGMIADFLKSTEDALQMNETKCVEQWVEKFEIEMKGPAQQD